MSIVTFTAASDKHRVQDLVDCVAFDDTGVGTAMGNYLSKSAGESLRSAGALSTVGLAFVLALVIGFWFGTVVDGWLGTKPVFTIVFFFLGLAAGVLNVFRIVSQAYPKRTAGQAAPLAPQAQPPRIPMADADPGDHELEDGER